MNNFTKPTFVEQIVNIAMPYGGLDFWIENLALNMNPDATWRALLLIGCLKEQGFEAQIRDLLVHQDSRVRAWACFALAQVGDEAAVERIHAMNADPSNRVRIHAWQAIQVLVGPEESSRIFPIRVPQNETLVLISEDSREMGDRLNKLFRGMGFPAIVTTTERDTLIAALKYRPGAIITDNQKGRDNLSGINMTWDICRQPELRETVIFMLTADFIEAVFLWHGGDYYLLKNPFNLIELGNVVNEYLHH
jgi:CheY-like chemotaxis protein